MRIKKENMQLVAPTLLTYTHNIHQASQKGSVFFFHGLTSSKDQQEKELSSLAERGFLVIGVDNVGHGDRRYHDFDWRFSNENPDSGKELIGAAAQTAREFPRLINAFVQQGIIREDKIGIIGVSMGGYIAYSAILQEPRIKAASVILGSPNWWEAESDSPHHYLERFYPTAILSQNAGKDTSVSPQFAREFHHKLEPHYAEAPERQHYIEYPNSGHFMLEEDWNECWEQALQWQEKFL